MFTCFSICELESILRVFFNPVLVFHHLSMILSGLAFLNPALFFARVYHSDESCGMGCGFILFLGGIVFIVEMINAGKKEKRTRKFLEKLKKEDPDFNEELFVSKTQTIFLEFQKAWQKGELSSVHRYFTDEQFKRLNIQLEEFKKDGVIEKIDNLKIMGADIDDAGISGHNYFIRVNFLVSMEQKIIDTKDMEKSRHTPPQKVETSETWTFIRKQGEKTPKEGEIKTQINCPGCGAPLEITGTGRCHYCDVMVVDTTFTWFADKVIREI